VSLDYSRIESVLLLDLDGVIFQVQCHIPEKDGDKVDLACHDYRLPLGKSQGLLFCLDDIVEIAFPAYVYVDRVSAGQKPPIPHVPDVPLPAKEPGTCYLILVFIPLRVCHLISRVQDLRAGWG
jgi:hypothetical protein